MVKGNLLSLENNVETIFIKLNSYTEKPERAWEGSIDKLNKTRTKIGFRVNLKKQIPLSKVKKYSNIGEGWHLSDAKKKSDGKR